MSNYYSHNNSVNMREYYNVTHHTYCSVKFNSGFSLYSYANLIKEVWEEY